MPTPLPVRTIFDGTGTPNTSAMKAAMGSLRDYLAGLLGTTGAASDALTALSPALAGIAAGTTATTSKNKIINGNFGINQRAYVSGAAVGAGLYGHDRWKMAASGDTYTFATVANVTTITIPAGKVLRQVIEGVNLQSGTHTLSWTGTAQGKIDAGSLSASGVTGTVTGGTNVTIEFGPGTVSKVQFEEGSIATPFENRPYGLELALCQRYLPAWSAAPGVVLGVGQAGNTTQASVSLPMRANTRIPPTGLSTTGSFAVTGAGFVNNAATLSFSSATDQSLQVLGTTGGGLAGGAATLLVTTSAVTILGTGCEL